MKKITSKKDLAINGAIPAFKNPLHVGSPWIGDTRIFHQYIDDIFQSNRLTNDGPLVQELEKRIAEIHDVKHCLAICNGTTALQIAIKALDLTGEVIVPSFTFIATVHATSWLGLTPVFADINPDTHNIDPESIRSRITKKTTGIIPVHLWGRAVPVEELQSIADEYNLKIICDAAHAFACSYKDKMIGNFGDCEVLSFHTTKFFNTFEGGAILTNNDELAEKIDSMRNFGFNEERNVIYSGYNGKMTEVCAAMGLVNLENIVATIQQHLRIYEFYRNELTNFDSLNIINYNNENKNNYQYIVIEVQDDSPVSRNQIIDVLHAENIIARKYFWPCCHRYDVFKELYKNNNSLLNSEKLSEKVIVLPAGPEIDLDQAQTIIDILKVIIES